MAAVEGRDKKVEPAASLQTPAILHGAHSSRNFILWSAVVPSAVLSSIVIFSGIYSSFWTGSHLDHFYLEIIAVMFDAIIAFYAIARAISIQSKFYLFIGIGFIFSVTIDLMHSLAAIEVLIPFFENHHIAQSWIAGRIADSALLLVTFLNYEKLRKDSDLSFSFARSRKYLEQKARDAASGLPRFERGMRSHELQLVLCTVSVSIIVALSFILHFPSSFISDGYIHRPYELIGIVLFLTAIFLFIKKRLWQNKDPFFRGLMLYMIISIFAGIIIMTSPTTYDTRFNVGHILKIASYSAVVLSLMVSSIRFNPELWNTKMELEAANERLMKLDRQKDDFIDIAAHELRTPIQPILGFVNLAKKGRISQEDALDGVLRQAKRLQTLANDILDVSRIENGTFTYEMTHVKINEIIENAVSSAKASLGGSTAVMIATRLDTDVTINADKARIRQLLANLLSNAVKFTEEGSITVATQVLPRKDTVQIRIIDTGKGIPEDILPNIFDKFITESVDGGSQHGSGLGLFLCKAIAEAHNGTIIARNRSDGTRGAELVVELPL